MYAACFDATKVAAAHEFCRARFGEALDEVKKRTDDGDGVCGRVVVVDNTNVTRREYEWYVRKASEAGMEHVVIELFDPRPNISGGASVHSVPAATVGRMRGRFELDDDAVRLRPWFEASGVVEVENGEQVVGQSVDDGQGGGSILSSNGSGELSRWLTSHHSVHYVKTKKKSHLAMACEGSSHHFLWVPPKLVRPNGAGPIDVSPNLLFAQSLPISVQPIYSSPSSRAQTYEIARTHRHNLPTPRTRCASSLRWWYVTPRHIISAKLRRSPPFASSSTWIYP